ncbi:hypothetical protein BV25DRAFT_1878804 [Artomyces pyxidatus]|uniref:Uncharacterized protein n=1 Tax=Artomyces pyxidatus TaxID=48021 RepID=A0ACB8TE56_9AGAM|nr:hypothetical protein BV25DRAFT_1878804 [Artomyces pyxidatus]
MSRSTRTSSFDDSQADSEPWQFIVLRSQNFGLLRPEKSWRPIVTLEVDGHRTHEIVLGTDGQNPNQRDPMLLREAHLRTELKVGVWHKSQSKSKSKKKRHLVASMSMPLGEVVKRQGNDRQLEIHLSGITAARRKSIAQKQQKCASLIVRLRAPSSASTSISEEGNGSCEEESVGSEAEKSSPESSASEECQSSLPWAEEPPNQLRRRRVKGYCINSDDETSGQSDVDDSTDLCTWESKADEEFEDSIYQENDTMFPQDTIYIQRRPNFISVILPSLLPLSTLNVSDTVSISSTVSIATSVFDTLTYHRELREAQLDSDFDAILGRLVHEWYFIGASLLSVAAVDATVFGFSTDSIFGVDGLAKRTLTISSIAAALGLGIDAWFILLYSGADYHKFQRLALDVYSTFFFFSLTARLPLLCLFVAVASLMVFLMTVAYAAWPLAVLVMCSVAGTLVSLQFLVYGCHKLVLGIAWMVRAWWSVLVWMARRVRGQRREGDGATVAAPPVRGVRGSMTETRETS